VTQTLPSQVTERTTVPSPRRPPKSPDRPASARRRDSFFDNAKFLAIVLVLVGHSWEPLTGDHRIVKAAYLLVYSFHMPAFIVISGYFSRSFDARPDRVRRLITGIAVPYIVFETAYSLFKRIADHDPGQPISLVDPWYLTWFLMALFIWRLSSPVWRVVRWPVPLALLVAALATTSHIGNDLDLQRVLQYLPFFVIGLCLRPEHFRWVRKTYVRIAALPVFGAALAIAWMAAPHMNRAWVYHRDSAQDLGAPAWTGVAMTLATFAYSVVLTFFFFSLVPGRKLWISSLGTGTLYAFLLHGFIAKGSRFWGWYDHDFVHTPLGMLTVSAIAVALALVLCSAPVRTIFRPLVEPDMSWAFRPEGSGAGGGSGARRGGPPKRRPAEAAKAGAKAAPKAGPKGAAKDGAQPKDAAKDVAKDGAQPGSPGRAQESGKEPVKESTDASAG
jgi:fucose 4-O-acetylase-like acetyltransferase